VVNFNRKTFAGLVLFVFFCSLLYPSLVQGEGEYVPEVVLDFLENSVKLDMQKYSLMASKPSEKFQERYGDLPVVIGTLSLHSNANELEVTYTVVGGKIFGLNMYVVAGSPMFSKDMPSDVKGIVGELLDGFKVVTKDDGVNAMLDLLSKVDGAKNESATSDNIKLDVWIRPKYSSFSWSFIYNGAVYNKLSLSFEDGVFSGFLDDRHIYGVGSTEVNVSSEKAVEVALGRAANFSYTFGGETYKDFVFDEQRIAAQLHVMGRDDPLLGIPYWTVNLPFKYEQPGFVLSVEVRLWADTGEIIDYYFLGYGGGTAPTITQNPTTNPDYTTTLLITTMIVATAAIATTAILIKRKQKVPEKNASCDLTTC